MDDSDEVMSDPAPRHSRNRKRGRKRQNLTTRQKNRQKARACEIAGDESDCAAYGSPVRKKFTKLKEYASQFKEAAFIPPVFYAFVRRLSNVKVKILMHKRVNGEDRYVLFLGEIHSNIRGGDTSIGEIVIPFLENATERVDFMLEENPRDAPAKFIIPENPTIINDLRYRLNPYVLKTKQFPNARVHWVDLIWPGADVNGMEIQGDHRADRLRRFLTLIFDLSREYYDDNLLRYYRHFNQISSFLQKYGDLPDLHRLDDTEKRKVFFMACLKVLRVPGEGRHIDTFTSCNFLDDDTYFEIFSNAVELGSMPRLDQVLFYIHRFLMDIYTCCRIMKTDPGWYKNVVVYAGAGHTQRCVGIMLEYGFTAKRIHYKRQL